VKTISVEKIGFAAIRVGQARAEYRAAGDALCDLFGNPTCESEDRPQKLGPADVRMCYMELEVNHQEIDQLAPTLKRFDDSRAQYRLAQKQLAYMVRRYRKTARIK
jgi:hypothetical protein